MGGGGGGAGREGCGWEIQQMSHTYLTNYLDSSLVEHRLSLSVF